MLSRELKLGEHETQIDFSKDLFYRLERAAGHLLLRRSPPAHTATRLLNLGAGSLCYEGWINADDYAFKRSLRERAFRPNWRLDITRPWKCADNYFDGIFSQHVVEHVPYSAAVSVFEECLRTLKPGGWLRVSVPDIRKFLGYYRGTNDDQRFYQFPQPALAISFLTQMHFHKSAWDADLMCRVLAEIGFGSVREVAFGEGTDPRIIKDQAVKAPESLYVEARKSIASA